MDFEVEIYQFINLYSSPLQHFWLFIFNLQQLHSLSTAMICNIQALSHEPLVWKDAFPPGFSGLHLAGSTVLTATGEFGSLCVQEFSTDNFLLRYNQFNFHQPCLLQSHYTGAAISSHLLLNGKLNQQLNHSRQWHLSKNQFVLFEPDAHQVISSYPPQKAFASLEALYSEQWIEEVKEVLSYNIPAHPSPYWANIEALLHAHSILHCPFEKKLRFHFFVSRMREMLFFLWRQVVHTPHVVKQPTEKELAAIYEAAAIISADITVHNHIRRLSRLVGINENKLKNLFRLVHGIGPYEYLVQLRMFKAKELLLSGLSVKEAAALTGYRPSDLTFRFIQFYGIPPSSLKKRNS